MQINKMTIMAVCIPLKCQNCRPYVLSSGRCRYDSCRQGCCGNPERGDRRLHAIGEPSISPLAVKSCARWSKKLKLDICYLSKAGRGFAHIMETNVLGLVSDGSKSKKADAFLLFKVCPTSIFSRTHHAPVWFRLVRVRVMSNRPCRLRRYRVRESPQSFSPALARCSASR